jgi:hypothetical protein
MTRDEHLARAKERALVYLEAGNPSMAIASLTSDLRKHEETNTLLTQPVLRQGTLAALDDMAELRADGPRVRRWIEGIS